MCPMWSKVAGSEPTMEDEEYDEDLPQSPVGILKDGSETEIRLRKCRIPDCPNPHGCRGNRRRYFCPAFKGPKDENDFFANRFIDDGDSTESAESDRHQEEINPERLKQMEHNQGFDENLMAFGLRHPVLPFHPAANPIISRNQMPNFGNYSSVPSFPSVVAECHATNLAAARLQQLCRWPPYFDYDAPNMNVMFPFGPHNVTQEPRGESHTAGEMSNINPAGIQNFAAKTSGTKVSGRLNKSVGEALIMLSNSPVQSQEADAQEAYLKELKDSQLSSLESRLERAELAITKLQDTINVVLAERENCLRVDEEMQVSCNENDAKDRVKVHETKNYHDNAYGYSEIQQRVENPDDSKDSIHVQETKDKVKIDTQENFPSKTSALFSPKLNVKQIKCNASSEFNPSKSLTI